MIVWLLATQSWDNSVAPGLNFLFGVLVMNVIFILLAATSYFSSAITEEKEEGTIALLQMANVSPTGLLLAKSGTRILEGLLLLAVQFPFALLAVTLGGVAWEQVAAAYLALVAFVFMAGNLALLASVVASRATTAAFGTAGLLLLVFLGDDLLALPARLLGIQVHIANWQALNPFTRLRDVTSLLFAGPIVEAHFWNSILVGTAAFVAARMLFERFSQPTAEGGPGWMNRFFSTSEDRQLAARPISHMAIEWKDYDFLYGGDRFLRWKVRAYIIIAGVLSLPALVRWDRHTLLLIGGNMVLTGVLGLLFETCFIASRMFSYERQTKTLATLLLIPDMRVESLIHWKEQVSVLMLRPVRLMLGSGLLVAFLGVLYAGFTTAMVVTAFATPVMLLLFWPFAIFYIRLLRNLIIHLSLRVSWGSMALGFSLWLLFILLTVSLLSLLSPLLSFWLSLIPTSYLSNYIARKNVALIQEVACEEG